MASETNGPKGQPWFAATGAPAIDVDPTEVADYAAMMGNHVADTAAKRATNLLPDGQTPVYTGLVWTETDTGRRFLCVVSPTPTWYELSGKPVSGTITFATSGGVTYSSGTPAATLTQMGPRVYMGGIVSSVSATFSNSTYNFGSIPTQFAPATDKYFACTSNGSAVGSVHVAPSGALSVIFNITFTTNPTTPLSLSLDNVSWAAK